MVDTLKGTYLGELLQKVMSCKDDYIKARSGIKTAIARVRSNMLQIKKLSEIIIREMNTLQNNREQRKQ
ncbi:MAG: hypothetical protein QXU32_01980 [Nitrososphaerales archaeon]